MAQPTGITFKKLCDHPHLCHQAAHWFAGHWSVPLAAYEASIRQSIQEPGGIPQWYLVYDDQGQIIAGAGIIHNDFHDRKDLTPNLCALFVEPAHRGRGVARRLLDYARSEVAGMGFEKLYLITDHTTFYEKCGWAFLTQVRGEDGKQIRMYEAVTGLL